MELCVANFVGNGEPLAVMAMAVINNDQRGAAFPVEHPGDIIASKVFEGNGNVFGAGDQLNGYWCFRDSVNV